MLLDRAAPRVLSVGEVPLIRRGHEALVVGAGHDLRIRLEVSVGLLGSNHGSPSGRRQPIDHEPVGAAMLIPQPQPQPLPISMIQEPLHLHCILRINEKGRGLVQVDTGRKKS